MRSLLVALVTVAGCRYRFEEIDGGPGDGVRGDGRVTSDDSMTGDGSQLTPRLIFITRGGPTGAIGGLAGADTLCADEATGGGLSGTFQAVLGAVSSDPKTRIVLTDGRDIVTPDGTKVATDATFFSTPHLAPINIGVDGTIVTGVAYSWTNFNPDGTAITADCQGWTSGIGSSQGGRGLINFTDANWSTAGTIGCNTTNHLICIQQ